MKEENREKYLYPALFKILVLAAVIIIFFIFYRFGEFKSVITRVVDILKPFLYGAVLAYLLLTSTRNAKHLNLSLDYLN